MLGNDQLRTLYNNSTSGFNAVTKTHAQRRRAATSTNPFGDYVDEEDPY